MLLVFFVGHLHCSGWWYIYKQKIRFTPLVLPYALCKCKKWIPRKKIHKNKSSLHFLGNPYSWWFIYINKKSRFKPFVLPYALSKCEKWIPCQKIHKNKSGFHFLGIPSSCFSLGRCHLNSGMGGRRRFAGYFYLNSQNDLRPPPYPNLNDSSLS